MLARPISPSMYSTSTWLRAPSPNGSNPRARPTATLISNVDLPTLAPAMQQSHPACPERESFHERVLGRGRREWVDDDYPVVIYSTMTYISVVASG